MAKYRVEFYGDGNTPKTVEADSYETADKFVTFRRYDDDGILQDAVASFSSKDVASVEKLD